MSDIYRHNKSGNLYILIGIGKMTDDARDVVIYQALYGETEVWVRDFDEFFGEVNDGNGGTIPRFSNIVVPRLENK